MKFTLRNSLMGLFGLMLALSVAQGIVTLTKLDAIDGKTSALLDNAIPSMNEANVINALVIRTRLWQFRYMTAESEAAKTESAGKVAEFMRDRAAKVEAYRALVASPAEQAAYDVLRGKLDVVLSDWERLRAYPADRYEEAMTAFRGPMNTNYLAASASVRALIDVNLAATRAADAALRQAQGDASRMTLIMLTVSLLTAVGATAFSFLGVSRPIGRMSAAMRRLAGGDTASPIPYGRRGDEIGEMAAAVGVFRDSMIRTRALEEETALARASAEEQRKAGMRQMADSFEAAVGGIVATVSASAAELRTTAQSMSANAEETAAQSVSVAAAAEQASANVQTVAVAAEELGASVNEIGRQVAGSADLAQSAVGEANGTGALVQDLAQAASRIGDVVNLISSIAAQTNLLALNATIEAARAGPAGRGFAVVAAEVKELASQTAQATAEISSQITQIQGSTDQAVSAIGGIAGRIREISSVATAIASAVEQQGAATREIVLNVGQAATGTGEVTSTIASVAGAAEETGAAASQMLASASALSQQADHLGSEVARFLATVRAA
ncbi:methyl-accepting chemotaxis protein [Methylorubrum thiocyanatum]|uniref:methyl-accepting chemotaxis protein n=1 Tax=Methylorubrum thiocyanatum TaxID=47958 RepID=UPI0035C8076A